MFLSFTFDNIVLIKIIAILRAVFITLINNSNNYV